MFWAPVQAAASTSLTWTPRALATCSIPHPASSASRSAATRACCASSVYGSHRARLPRTSRSSRATRRAALRRINRAHARWPISEEDSRYVLATLLVVPMRWLDRYGWRPVTATERRAAYLYHRELGLRMGVRAWPEGYDEVAAFLDAYE